MALNAKKQGNEKKQFAKQEDLEAGVYPARLVQVLDLGLQNQREFNGEKKAPVNEIMFTYELVDAFMKDEEGNDLEDKPRWVSETLPFYGLYADRAKSTQRIKAMDPNDDTDGAVGDLVGTPVNVTLVINKRGDKTYTNVAGVAAMRPRDAAKCPELVNPPKVFDLDEPDMEVFNKLPEWLRDKIKGNLNYKGSTLEAAIEGKAGDKGGDKPKPDNRDQGNEGGAKEEGPPWDEDENPY